MKLEWWVLAFALVALSIGYVVIQNPESISFAFLLRFIWPVLMIVFGDVIGPFMVRMFPLTSRLSMGPGMRAPGLFVKVLGWLWLFGDFLVQLIGRSMLIT